MNECIFCKIVSGEVPSSKVYEDDKSLAFINIQQINPGHTLVIPKDHKEEFHEVDSEGYDSLMRAVREVARALKQTYKPVRVGMMVQGFEVAHGHIHLVPLFNPTDITSKKIIDKTTLSPSPDEMTQEAAKIKKNL